MYKETFRRLSECLQKIAKDAVDAGIVDTFKITINDQPAIDISINKDMSEKTVETPIDFDKEIDNSTDPREVGYAYVEEPCVEEESIDRAGLTDASDVLGVNICNGVVKDPYNEIYYLDQFVNNDKVLIPEVELRFTESVDGYVAPGLTDAQLAFVLLYRNRDNKERYDALMQFIKTIC